jgi:hypothetical protein
MGGVALLCSSPAILESQQMSADWQKAHGQSIRYLQSHRLLSNVLFELLSQAAFTGTTDD